MDWSTNMELQVWIMLVLLILFLIGIFIVAIAMDNEIEEFCKSRTGVYENDHCYIKHDGKWNEYRVVKLNDKWRLIK